MIHELFIHDQDLYTHDQDLYTHDQDRYKHDLELWTLHHYLYSQDQEL